MKGSPILRQIALPIEIETNEEIRGISKQKIITLKDADFLLNLGSHLIKVMDSHDSLTITASQVGVNARMMVVTTGFIIPNKVLKPKNGDTNIHTSSLRFKTDYARPRIFINPIFRPIEVYGKHLHLESSCSVPNLIGIVERYDKISLSAYELTIGSNGLRKDYKLEKVHETLKYTDSYMTQHCADMLDGILYIDKIKELFK